MDGSFSIAQQDTLLLRWSADQRGKFYPRVVKTNGVSLQDLTGMVELTVSERAHGYRVGDHFLLTQEQVNNRYIALTELVSHFERDRVLEGTNIDITQQPWLVSVKELTYPKGLNALAIPEVVFSVLQSELPEDNGNESARREFSLPIAQAFKIYDKHATHG